MLGSMSRRRLTGLVSACGALGLVVLALAWLPGTGSASTSRASNLSIDKIQAVFSDPDRATTYSVPVHESASATLSYVWTLTLTAVDPAVDVDGLTIDANCDNHGMLSGTDPTFVWHHGNKGDPFHDDDCNHDLQGKYGHQGLISVTVTDSAGWRCDATYKGTLSSGAAAVAGLDVASEPVCNGPSTPPPPPPPTPKKPPPKPCKCIQLTARIVPDSLTANLVAVHVLTASKEELEITFTVHWVMTCLNGAVAACRGSLTVDKPPAIESNGDQFGVFIDGDRSFKCKGGCGGLQDGAFKVTLATEADRTEVAGHRIPVVIRRTCQARRLSPIRLSIAFDKKGRPDRTKSKLR